jgi:hypothetical protein
VTVWLPESECPKARTGFQLLRRGAAGRFLRNRPRTRLRRHEAVASVHVSDVICTEKSGAFVDPDPRIAVFLRDPRGDTRRFSPWPQEVWFAPCGMHASSTRRIHCGCCPCSATAQSEWMQNRCSDAPRSRNITLLGGTRAEVKRVVSASDPVWLLGRYRRHRASFRRRGGR